MVWSLRIGAPTFAALIWTGTLHGQVEPRIQVRVTYHCSGNAPRGVQERPCRETGVSLSSSVNPLRWQSDQGDVLTTPLSALIRLERRRPGLSTPEAIVVVYLTTALGSLSGGALGCLVGPKSAEDGCLFGATLGLLVGAGLGLHHGRVFVASRKAKWVPVVLHSGAVGLSLGYALPLPR